MPSISFEVSRAQQRANRATIHDLMEVNGIIRKTEFLVANRIGIVFKRKEYLGLPLVVGIHDASFAQEDGLRSQRGYIGLLCDPWVMKTKAEANHSKGDAINLGLRGSQF